MKYMSIGLVQPCLWKLQLELLSFTLDNDAP